MKETIKNLFCGALVCGSLLAAGDKAFAGAQGETPGVGGSFQTTNQLVNGVNYLNYPTNAANIATGTALSLENYNTVGVYVDCDVTNNAAAKLFFNLVRSTKITTSTGSTTNWETTPVYGCFITIPAMTNHFTWMTNLPNDFAGCAIQTGLTSLTNNLAAGQQMNNLNIGVIKKIIPIVYP